MISTRFFDKTLLTLTAMLAFAACGDDTSETTKSANGEACEDGSTCESALCFIGPSGDGECRAAPAACNGDLSCSDDACFEELGEECGDGFFGCVGIGNQYTVECSTPPQGGGGSGGGEGGAGGTGAAGGVGGVGGTGGVGGGL